MAGGWVIAMQSALQDLLPANIRATATSIWAFALTFCGLVLGVQFAGIFNDLLTEEYGSEAIRYAMAITLLPTIPAALCILMAGRTVAPDRTVLVKAFETDTI
jgi:MFS family permease